MKKEKKSEKSLRGLLKKTKKRRSSSNMKDNYQSNVSSVGLKEVESEDQSNISLFDDVNTCPLSIYIEVTCDDSKLKNLIIKGSPTQEQLEEARFKLVSDFCELSNNGESQVIYESINNFYYQRNLIIGYELCLKLILAGKFDKAIEYLNDNGLTCSIPQEEEEYQKLIRTIQMKLKNRMVKYKEAQNRYKTLSSGKGEKKPTRKYYNKLIVMLSTCEVIKIQLRPKDMTVSEFAEYLNMFNEYQNHLKIRNNKQG